MAVMHSAPRALAELNAQHDMLRGMMDRCEDLADELDAGRCGPTQLTREITRLRLAFEAHNKYEEQLLRPVLLGSVAAAELERMVDQHVEEHRIMRQQLQTSETSMLREVIDSMRCHLEAEERYLASTRRLAVAAAD
jgi:hypothetical protein